MCLFQEERGRLQRLAGEERPGLPDVRPGGRPDVCVQLERQAAIPLPGGRVPDAQERAEPGGALGQDHPARRERQDRRQEHQHQVLFLGRRQRPQVSAEAIGV